MRMSLSYNVYQKLYLLLGQGYRWNTLILHLVYIAYNLFKGLLIVLTVDSLDLWEQTMQHRHLGYMTLK